MSNGPGMDTPKAAFSVPGDPLFEGLVVPVCLVDADGRIVDMNPAAESLWALKLGVVAGQPAMQALGIVPADGGSDAWGRLSPPSAYPQLPCRITTQDGAVRPASVIYSVLSGTTPALGALFIIEGAMAEVLSDLPEWALRDPVTGLGNRHLWDREADTWSHRSGCVVFLDLDDLKEVNDLYGHIAGDRLLAAAGQALSDVAPPDALTVRYGGDEFIVILPDADAVAGEAWAQSAIRHVVSSATSADLPTIPRLSHGVAAFGPSELQAAVRRADDVLYERKGVLLPAKSGGRIILTREGVAALREPTDGHEQSPPGAFGAGFGPEFEKCFQTQYARAAEQAREFVRFVDPTPGTAAVEVGAGSGRITFDGGLAERIGPTGQLVVTDPSAAQVRAARKHAQERGLGWIRFLRTPVEDLPMASGTADLVTGALFLHFTEPMQAIREMARVVRPGGRVAISAGLEHGWPPTWQDALAPVRRAVEAEGLPWRHFFLQHGQLEDLMAAAGLKVERSMLIGPDTLEFPSADFTVALGRQIRVVRLLLRGRATDRLSHLQEEFERRVREGFQRWGPKAWSIGDVYLVSAVSRRPG